MSFCLLIVFVIKANGAQKDLDNMANAVWLPSKMYFLEMNGNRSVKHHPG